MNKTSLKTLALASLIALTTSGAFAGFTTGDQLAISDADIRSRLEADGYTVLSIKREGDEIEIEVEAQSADGVVEFEISASTGIILETETEDDSDDEEDADEGNEDTDAAEDDDKDDA